MKNLVRYSTLLGAFAAALSASAQTTAYSNLGADPYVYFNGSTSYLMGGNGVSAQFVPTATGSLSAFAAGLNTASTGTFGFTFSFYANGPSDTRGALLASYTGATNVYVSTSTLTSFTIPNGPTLFSGTPYWVNIAPAAALYWGYSSSATGQLLNANNSGGYEAGRLPAFSVTVNPVPEPSALAALGLGAVALLRRRKRA